MKHPLRFSENPLMPSLNDLAHAIEEGYSHFMNGLEKNILEYMEVMGTTNLTQASQRSLITLPLRQTPFPDAFRKLII